MLECGTRSWLIASCPGLRSRQVIDDLSELLDWTYEVQSGCEGAAWPSREA